MLCRLRDIGKRLYVRTKPGMIVKAVNRALRPYNRGIPEWRGLLHEELTRSATGAEASEVAGKNLDLYLCANRTCDVEMEHATRVPYESFLYSLEELTRT